jgi:pimeloyl-ACP methyl ester carboxylesterase
VLIRIGGLETYYTLEGRGQPVLLLHGWGASSESLHGIGAALRDAFRILAVDLPGFGWSPAPPEAWGNGEYAGHIRRLLDETGIGRAAVLGHSFGGRIAVHLAARDPARVARLVLVASAGIRSRRGPAYYARVAGTKLVKRLFALPGWGAFGQRVQARWVERFGSRDYRTAGRMRPTLVKVVNEDVRPLLPSIGAPTLILWGDRDTEVGPRAMSEMAAGIRGARLSVFPGAGHFPFLDAPDEFRRRLRTFLLEGERW